MRATKLKTTGVLMLGGILAALLLALPASAANWKTMAALPRPNRLCCRGIHQRSHLRRRRRQRQQQKLRSPIVQSGNTNLDAPVLHASYSLSRRRCRSH